MNKMVGVSCLQPDPDFQLMRDAGIGWVRAFVPFPFADASCTTLSDRYIASRKKIDTWIGNGFHVTGVTLSYGMMYASKGSRSLQFRRFIPDWVGSVDSEEFYQTLEKAFGYAAKDLAGRVNSFQIANEMDITRFRGEMTQEQACKFMYHTAKGIKRENPRAAVYINTSCMTNPESTYFYETLYSPDCAVYFDWAGVDYYFGSHHPGTPYDWPGMIDRIYSITKRPILVAEWGYSSIGDYLTDGWGPEPNKAPNENGEFPVCARGAWAYAWKGAHNQQIQAEYFEVALRQFFENDKVIGFFEYDWKDDPVCFCGRENCPHECGWGMIDRNGKPKPAYYTFQRIVRQYEARG